MRPRIINLSEFQLAEKRFALLGSFLVVSWFALTALRFEDLRGFASYLIGLAVLMSLGMLVERHTGYNVFYEWGHTILEPIATVAPSPTDIHPSPEIEEGRIIVVGPTLHGLAATAMLVMVMPFALVRVLDAELAQVVVAERGRVRADGGGRGGDRSQDGAARSARARDLHRLLPPAPGAAPAAARARRLRRLAHLAAPGTLGTLLNLNADASSGSTAHRVGDFTRPQARRARPSRARSRLRLDQCGTSPSSSGSTTTSTSTNCGRSGVVGLLAFVWMILAPVVLARAAIRTRGPTVSSLALAASGGCVAFLVVCALFDAWASPRRPTCSSSWPR